MLEVKSVKVIVHGALDIIANAAEEVRLIQCILSSCLESGNMGLESASFI